MTDDEILDAIDRRFAEVETRLPPQRLVTLTDVGRGADARPRPGMVLRVGPPTLAVVVLIAIGAVALGIVGRPNGRVGTAGESASLPAIGAATPRSTNPSSDVGASPSPADLEVIRNETWDGDAVLIQHLHWGPCFVSSDALRAQPDGRLLDEAIDQAGVEEGFVALNGGRSPFWVGPTAESAARGYGSPILVIDRRSTAWIASPRGYQLTSIGYQLIRTDTPKGRTAWSLGNSVREVPCSGG